MKHLKHVFVTLLDLLETLPFGFAQQFDGKTLAKMNDDEKNMLIAEGKLFEFAVSLEKTFGERLCYIGEDVIGEKFYKRFLFEKGGFIEVMTGLPVAMNAHFSDMKRAEKFALALKKSLAKFVKDRKKLELVANLVEIREDDPLTVETWHKIHVVRGE